MAVILIHFVRSVKCHIHYFTIDVTLLAELLHITVVMMTVVQVDSITPRVQLSEVVWR